jgi:glycosidase
MQIYVRAYADSDGDGIGDFQGVIGKLGYLKDLGIRGLWLMPVTQSQDHDHGYAVSDYRNVETAYGRLADLQALIGAAHAKGIGIMLDYVINHSAATNPLFLNASASRDNPYRNWYLWSDSHPAGWSIYGSDPWRASGGGYYFGGFSEQMPDWNLKNADVIAYHKNNLRFWLNMGVDGFRFDAVTNLVENGPTQWEDQPEDRTIMADLAATVNQYANRTMVCEAPPNPRPYMAACGSAFAFDNRPNLVNAAKGVATAIAAVSVYPLGLSGQANFAANHDSFTGGRLYDQLAGNPGQYKLVAATYLLQPGIPYIYYGEEIGMSGAASLSGDAAIRTPMSWTATAAGFTGGSPFRALSGNIATHNLAAQIGDANSIYTFYKDLIAVRNANPALQKGVYTSPWTDGRALSYTAVDATQRVAVAINYGTVTATITVNGLPAGTTLAQIFPAGVAATYIVTARQQVQLDVPAQGVAVLVVR